MLKTPNCALKAHLGGKGLIRVSCHYSPLASAEQHVSPPLCVGQLCSHWRCYLSPSPFRSPLLFPLPPQLHCRRFFRSRFELIVVCAPRNRCCHCCLCRRRCHQCQHHCRCRCCHHRCHHRLAVIVLGFVLWGHLILSSRPAGCCL